MSSKTTLFLHALTPVHTGTGQSVGVVDLPIAREKATGWPVIPASSLKGLLRSKHEKASEDKSLGLRATNELYGSADRDGKPGSASELLFGDLHLLCFPVRSLYGTFSYLTCPLALSRYIRLVKALELQIPEWQIRLDGKSNQLTVLTTAESALHRKDDKKVFFDDLDLTATHQPIADDIAKWLSDLLFTDTNEKKLFTERFAIGSDDVFSFLAENATEINARVKLETGTKVVAQGGLWYEESIPAEAIFCGPLLLANRSGNGAGELPIASQTIRIGGKESVGRGLCRLIVPKEEGRAA